MACDKKVFTQKLVTYQILYPELNVTQHKTLVTNDSYEKLYKPSKAVIDLYNLEKRFSANKRTISESQYNQALSELKGFPELFFTDASPFFEAMATGILNCNGSFPVVFKELF